MDAKTSETVKEAKRLLYPYMGPHASRKMAEAEEVRCPLKGQDHPAVVYLRKFLAEYDEENLVHADSIARWRRIKNAVDELLGPGPLPRSLT